MKMGEMDHSQHQMPQQQVNAATSSQPAMDHSAHAEMNMSKMDHSQHQIAQDKQADTSKQHAGMDHGSQENMDMSQMDHSAHAQMSMKEMEHGQHQMADSSAQEGSTTVQGWANAATPAGQKALAYADLQSLQPQPEKYSRPAEREVVIRLGGTMERYIWTIDGKKFSDPDFKPLTVRYGERIRLKFVTMH